MIRTSSSLYRGHRFPAEVIAHAVWLYFRFPLSLRMCRFTLQCGTRLLLDFNQLAGTEVSLEAFQSGLPQVFWALKVGLIDRSIDRIVGQ